MNRRDLLLIGAAAAMCAAAAMRTASLLHGSALPAERPPAAASTAALPNARMADVPPWSRPLFSRPSRAPSSAEDPNSTGSVAERDRLPHLIGIILQDPHRLAVFAYAGKVVRVAANAKIGDWTLARIEARSALLQKGEERQLLKLDPATQ